MYKSNPIAVKVISENWLFVCEGLVQDFQTVTLGHRSGASVSGLLFLFYWSDPSIGGLLAL